MYWILLVNIQYYLGSYTLNRNVTKTSLGIFTLTIFCKRSKRLEFEKSWFVSPLLQEWWHEFVQSTCHLPWVGKQMSKSSDPVHWNCSKRSQHFWNLVFKLHRGLRFLQKNNWNYSNLQNASQPKWWNLNNKKLASCVHLHNFNQWERFDFLPFSDEILT